jgi:hypothetical protein
MNETAIRRPSDLQQSRASDPLPVYRC